MAVAQARGQEAARTARAAAVARDPGERRPGPRGRASGGDGRLGRGRADPPPSDAAGDRPAETSAALVRRVQAGDGDAFGELYDRYVDQVFRYVVSRVPVRAVAEDLTSETFLRALRGLGSFREQGHDVGAWLVTIARNLVADHYKSGRYRLELVTDDLREDASPAEGPEGLVLARLEHAALLQAVRRLSPDQQECVALRFLQGLSVAETAEVMGRNQAAVKALQHRAVRALARLLPPEGAP